MSELGLLNLPEITPVFKNCRVMGVNVKQHVYRHQDCKKGDPNFVMGQGSIMDFQKCPLKWLKTAEQDESSDAMKIGSAVDIRLLTPEHEKNSIAVQPVEYPSEDNGKTIMKSWHNGSNYCKKWQEVNADKLVLSQKDNEKVNAMVAALDDDCDSEMLIGSQKQVMVTGFIVIEDMDIPVKALIDVVPDKNGKWHDDLIDLKCTNSLSPRVWKRHIFDFGLYVQGAFYLDLYNQATGENRTTFSNFVVEDSEPYITERRILSQNFIKLGRMHYADAFLRYKNCLEFNTWPSYDTIRPVIVEPDAWMIQ